MLIINYFAQSPFFTAKPTFFIQNVVIITTIITNVVFSTTLQINVVAKTKAVALPSFELQRHNNYFFTLLSVTSNFSIYAPINKRVCE